jgi:hypothetical protein
MVGSLLTVLWWTRAGDKGSEKTLPANPGQTPRNVVGFLNRKMWHWGSSVGRNIYYAATNLCPKAEPQEQRGLVSYTLECRLQRLEAKFNPYACMHLSWLPHMTILMFRFSKFYLPNMSPCPCYTSTAKTNKQKNSTPSCLSGNVFMCPLSLKDILSFFPAHFKCVVALPSGLPCFLKSDLHFIKDSLKRIREWAWL